MENKEYFEYTELELNKLKKKDKKLSRAIDEIGNIKRAVNSNVFETLIHSIIGQQITIQAQKTIWERLQSLVSEISPDKILNLEIEKLNQIGIPKKRISYILDIAQKVYDKEIDLDSLNQKSDQEIIDILTSFKGIGVWTAEMVLIFALNRKNVFSYGDVAIHRGLRILYSHKEIDKIRFEKYRRRYAPYGSIASLYLWEISKSKVEEK